MNAKLAGLLLLVSAESLAHGMHHTPCKEGDCTDYESGYQWAMDGGVSTREDCNAVSQSFKRGCIAFLQDAGFETIIPPEGAAPVSTAVSTDPTAPPPTAAPAPAT